MSDPLGERDSESAHPLEDLFKKAWKDDPGASSRPVSDYARALSEAIAKELAASGGGEEELDLGSDAGALFGPYQLVRRLGSGGQGVVWEAVDTRLGRRAAVKILSGIGPGNHELLARFRREAETASRLDHAGICTIYEAGMQGLVPWIAMRYLEGETLAQRIRASKSTFPEITTHLVASWKPDPTTEPLSPPDGVSAPRRWIEVCGILELFEKAARALQAAHDAGVVHRDVKPGNIMVTHEGEPVLLDFGLARSDDDLQTLTREGDFFGTPAYMAPEQLAHQRIRVDHRADVYALGVSLYETLTLKRPFEAPTREALFQAIMTKEPVDPRSLNRALPADLSVVVSTALEKDRDRRYQSAEALGEELRRVRLREPIRARPIGPWVKLRRWGQRNPGLMWSLVLAAVSLVGGLSVSLFLLAERSAALMERSAALDAKNSVLSKYRQVSAAALMRHLSLRADELWPRTEEKIPSFEAWLSETRELASSLGERSAELSALKTRSLPLSEADQPLDLASRRARYPEFFWALDAKEADLSELDVLLEGNLRPARREREEERRATLSRELAGLAADPRTKERMVYRFTDPEAARVFRSLWELAQGQEAFLALIEDVSARLEFARSVRRRSLDDEKHAWDRCRRMLREESSLELSPIVGLVPLGRDRSSRLFEFWVLGSGSRPSWEGNFEAGTADASDPDGGIVLVLIPGGRFDMGAQPDPSKPAFDPHATPFEQPVHEVELAPFLFAKYELTQAQYSHVIGKNPSFYRPGQRFGDHVVTARNPVENVTSWECREAARRYGLALPTEAQWEYAARAGTKTPWWTGEDQTSLQGKVNLGDRSAQAAGNQAFSPEFEDGYAVHAPAGAFPPNPFGLHEVLGNVWEWCQDSEAPYTTAARPKDGLRGLDGLSRNYINRGGSHFEPPDGIRSALRRSSAEFRIANLGCRLASNLPE